MKMNLGETPTDNGTTITAQEPCGGGARSHPLAVLSFVLAIVAVVMLVMAGIKGDRCFLTGRTHWLIVGVLVPAACALVCGVVVSLTKESRGKGLARFGFTVAILCAVVVWALPGLLAEPERRKRIPRVCIAKMRNIESAFHQGFIECPTDALNWTNSASISPVFLKNPNTVCCPLSPGVPYPCFPTSETVVVCPNAGIAPDHTL